MARWAVHRNDTQFAVQGLAELRDLAKAGRLAGGDMVQPPGATGWMYASEIPELRDALTVTADEPSYAPPEASGSSPANVAVALVLLGVIGASGWFIASNMSLIPDEASVKSEMQLDFSELVVTVDGAQLVAEPREGAPVVRPVARNTRLDLLAKRGAYYHARGGKSGEEGWVLTQSVLPVYRLGGAEVSREVDPLYNPDQYVKVSNVSWMKQPEKKGGRNTVFSFMLNNASAFDMTELKLLATIKDSKGHELEKIEFPVQGVLPAMSDTMVGTVVDPTTKEKQLLTQASYMELMAEQPDSKAVYTEGAEVEMKKDDFNAASIEIVELRAIPKADAPR
jgi:hypothetical protein